jgi:hypothetical protein
MSQNPPALDAAAPGGRHDTFTASHSRQPARVFRKLDAVTVPTARLLPTPLSGDATVIVQAF